MSFSLPIILWKLGGEGKTNNVKGFNIITWGIMALVRDIKRGERHMKPKCTLE